MTSSRDHHRHSSENSQKWGSFYSVNQQTRRRGLLQFTESVILTSTVVYSSNASAADLQTVLSDPTDDQISALISGLSGNPTGVGTAPAILGPLPAQPVVTTSTTTENSWTASWTGDNSYDGYQYTCELTNIFDWCIYSLLHSRHGIFCLFAMYTL